MDGMTGARRLGEMDAREQAARTEAARAELMRSAACAYLRRGWAVVPLPPGSKAPVLRAWQELRLTEADVPQWFGAGGWRGPAHPPRPVEAGLAPNVGLLLGEASGGLVDVDCDALEAARAALLLLPFTGRVSGRESHPASHYWYVIEGALPRTAKFAVEGSHHGGESPTGAPGHTAMLVELRSSGCQTVAPPSRHPGGELVRWEREGELGRVCAEALLRSVARVAAAALLARHWPGKGTRDEAALALSGMLVRGGWSVAEADQLTRAVAYAAGDEEWRRRGGKAARAAERLAAGASLAGATALAEKLRGVDGAGIVRRARQWLGLTESPEHGPAANTSASDKVFPVSKTTGSTVNTFVAADSGLPATRHVGRGTVAAHVVGQRIRWLWPGRIPLGNITVLDGDPGLGKSLVTLDLAARVTTGCALPDGVPGWAEGPAGVVLLSAEDDVAATIRPRLDAAGADLTRVFILETVEAQESTTGALVRERGVLLPDDVEIIEQAIKTVSARLVIIDPLMAYLDSTLNSWRDQDVRAALLPLARLAGRAGVAVLILRHLTKGAGTNALYRGGGSIGIIGAARSGLLVAKSPDDPEHERILASTKSNLGPPMPSLRYRLNTHDAEGVRVEWLGASDETATSLLRPHDGEDVPEYNRAMQVIRGLLAEGPRPAKDILAEGEAQGLGSTTLYTVAHRLGVRFEKLPGAAHGNTKQWRLPPQGEPTAETRRAQTPAAVKDTSKVFTILPVVLDTGNTLPDAEVPAPPPRAPAPRATARQERAG